MLYLVDKHYPRLIAAFERGWRSIFCSIIGGFEPEVALRKSLSAGAKFVEVKDW